MASDGWAGIGWPEEYGGQGRSQIEQFIFFDESMRAGAPVPMLTINSVAPTIMRYGSQEQKDFFLPRILEGEIHFAIGYTEPDSGTDLASLRTRAERDGDEYVINGQKIFTSLATDADYIWLAVRTDPTVKKHKGISIIIVPTDTPGFKCEPISNMGGFNTNATFYEDIHVPVGNLVGEENQGWNLITNQLNHERVTLCASGIVERQLEDVIEWAKLTPLADGRRVIDQEWVQLNLARVHARLDYLRLANWKIADGATRGEALDPAAASAIKVFGTEFYLEAFRLLMEILGPVARGEGGLAGGRAAGPARGPHPQHAHPHLRRWHERDAAGPDRHLRPGHARVAALSRSSTTGDDDMDFTLTEEQEELRGLARQILTDRMDLGPAALVRREHRLVRPRDLRRVRQGGAARRRAAGVGRRPRLRLPRAVPDPAGAGPGGGADAAPALDRHLRATRSIASAPTSSVPTSARRSRARRSCTAAFNELGTSALEPADDGHARGQRVAARGQEGVRADGARRRADPRARRASATTSACSSSTADQPAVTLERQEVTNHEPQFVMHLDGALVGDEHRVGELAEGRAALRFAVQHTIVGICAIVAGACQEALRITARVHDRAQAVRPRHRHLPGRRSAPRRRVHRHAGDRADDAPGGDDARRWRRRGHGGRDREVLGIRGRQPRGPRRAPRPRRHLHRPRLPDPPLLPVDQGARVHPGLRDRAAARPGCG